MEEIVRWMERHRWQEQTNQKLSACDTWGGGRTDGIETEGKIEEKWILTSLFACHGNVFTPRNTFIHFTVRQSAKFIFSIKFRGKFLEITGKMGESCYHLAQYIFICNQSLFMHFPGFKHLASFYFKSTLFFIINVPIFLTSICFFILHLSVLLYVSVSSLPSRG